MNFRKQQLDKARQFVNAGLYDDAESVLKNLGDDPQAKAWLNRLKKYRKGELPTKSKESLVMPSTTVFGAPRLPLKIITINMLIVAVGAGIMIIPKVGFQAPMIILTLLIVFFVGLLFQVIYYNLYWWIMAVGWTLASVGMIYAILIGINLFFLGA